MEPPPIIHDLTIIIVLSATVSFLFHGLKWPPILGYLLSGIIVGPHAFGSTAIINRESILQLSDLGVVFLMFYIGLEFDLKKLKTLISSSLLAVFLQTIGMMLLGILAAKLLGWSSINGLFIGGILAISSTMVTYSVLGGQGGLKLPYGQLALGILILEDIIAIVLLVVFAGVAVTGRISIFEVGNVVFLVGIFVAMVFFFGKLVAPRLLKWLGGFDSSEMITLFSLAFALGLGLLAEEFHFSIALGAFLAGAILSQSILSHEIEQAVTPFRNLFTSVFFVTVGMLIDPATILTYWKQIALVAVLTIIGKVITVFFGLFLSGQNPKHSFQASLCKSQIGEFGFIIAGMGQTLGVAHEGLSALAVGVALLTILTTPLLTTHSAAIYQKMRTCVPDGLLRLGRIYQEFLQMVRARLNQNAILKLLRRPLLQIIGYFALFNGIILMASWGAGVLYQMEFFEHYAMLIILGVWILAAVLCLPFLVAVIRNFDAMILIISDVVFQSNHDSNGIGERLRALFHGFLLCIVTLFFTGIYLSAASVYFPSGFAIGLFVIVTVIVTLFAWNGLIKINSRMETMFIDGMEQMANTETLCEAALKQINEQYPWPISLKEVVVADGSYACGKKIKDLDIRSRIGASIIGVNRQGYTEYDPHPSTTLFPGDRIFVMAEDQHIHDAVAYLTNQVYAVHLEQHAVPSFKLHQVLIGVNSPFVNETLASSNVRRQFGVNIVGIQRNEVKITSPAADEIIKLGDVLILVGSVKAVEAFEKFEIQEHPA